MAQKIVQWRTADGMTWADEESAEQHERTLLTLPAPYRNANRLWRVTTEGDVEGRSVNRLGEYQGHLADIAAFLSDKVYYTLTFDAIDPIVIAPPTVITEEGKAKPMDSGVHVALAMKSKTWDINGGGRVAVFNRHYATDRYEFTDGTYYASVKMVLKK